MVRANASVASLCNKEIRWTKRKLLLVGTPLKITSTFPFRQPLILCQCQCMQTSRFKIERSRERDNIKIHISFVRFHPVVSSVQACICTILIQLPAFHITPDRSSRYPDIETRQTSIICRRTGYRRRRKVLAWRPRTGDAVSDAHQPRKMMRIGGWGWPRIL